MNKYVAVLTRDTDTPPPQDLLQAHVRHLESLDRQGALFICGPLKGSGNALQILIAETYEAARTHVLADPFISSGFCSSFTLYELNEANAANGFLL